MSDKVNSKHTFLFPFKWDYNNSTKELFKLSYRIRTDVVKFAELLNDKWDEKQFIADENNYSNFIYFYDFVRDALFNHDYNNHLKHLATEEQHNQLLKYFEFDVETDQKYIIEIENNREYILDIEKINLFVYSTGVGVLCYFLKSHYSKREDILRINEYGRRIYPQYLAEQPFTKGPKGAFLSSSLKIGKSKDEFDFKEDFSHFDNAENIKKNPLKISDHILKLLGNNFKTLHNKTAKNNIYIAPVLDDRMFVISWYDNDEIVNELASLTDGVFTYKYENNDFWYSYVFLDKKEMKPSCQNPIMMKELLKKHTYTRWINDKQLFGVSRYSFVGLSGDGADWLQHQMMGNYFYLVLLNLVQRACILKFADEVSEVALLEKTKKSEFSGKVHQLYKEFIRFSNKIYFKEVTAQEQGIELYDMIQASMNIEMQLQELKGDINELHQFTAFVENKIQTKETVNLTKVATFFLPAGLITAILALPGLINWRFGAFDLSLVQPFFASVFFIGILSVGVFYLIYFVLNFTENKNKLIQFIQKFTKNQNKENNDK